MDELDWALSPNSTPSAAPIANCGACCRVYTARLVLDPKGYNSIQYFKAATLTVLALSIVAATILVGRQQKRRPDINSFQRKLLIFVIGLIFLHIIGGILPITMGSIVVAYGYSGSVPWYLWACSAIITGATWSVAWFICYIFYFTPHRAGWMQLLLPPSIVFIVLWLAQFLGSELGRGDNIWWGYIASEILLLPWFLFVFINAFLPLACLYPRPVLRYWAGYLITMHTLYLTTFILIEKDKEGQYCVGLVQDAFFSATFALVIYFVLQLDGKYLAEETAPLLDLYKEGNLNLIPWDELEIERDIKGAGSQGTVFKARWGSELVAIKKIMILPPSDHGSAFGSNYGISSSSAAHHEEASQALSREANYLMELRHPSIVQFYGVTKFPDGKDVFGIVTKYMEHNLFGVIQEQVLSQATPISWITRLKWIRDIAFGLKYLHSKSINHGDIKSMNVLLSADLQSCQLCDFGSAGRTATATMHTPQWSAPEVLQGSAYSRKSDVYSFGVLVWEIVTFNHPYQRSPVLEVQRLIKEGKTPLKLWPELIPDDTPEVITKIMEAALRKSPSKRPTMESICSTLATTNTASTADQWMLLGDDIEREEDTQLENDEAEDPLIALEQ